MTREKARLIYAAGASDPDMRCLSGFEAPDPQLFVSARGESWLLLTDLEIDRARTSATVDHIAAWSDFNKVPISGTKSPRRRQQPPRLKSRTPAQTIAAFLKSIRVSSAEVPATFPAGLMEALRREGIRLKPSSRELFVPEREFKSKKEIALLVEANRIAEAGLARAFEILRASVVGRGRVLRWGGAILTAEVLRAEMEICVLRHGAHAQGTIVACGDQACDPHERGRGPLRANELIILDLFPRASSGYYGDITRTVIKGRASEAQRALWNTVLEGQRQAIGAIRPGESGAAIHARIVARFAELGYPTEKRAGRHVGFFHGTGHGLGLELHEAPRFAAAKFRPGQVFTVEPGLYYPGLGGVRHEDVIAVGHRGCQSLTTLPKPFEL